ncbi:serine/threonine protein kinase [Coemansia sp. RSA 552]|nr:serine/threonine protein kinase [Coemansia sp. RSA 552]
MNVRHENIIRTHEVVVEPGQVCYVVMEACVVDLLTLLQRRGPEIPQATLDGYFAQLVRGVHYLHAAGIAHRDLKLDNVCVTEQGVVKIVDFGCATLFRRRRRVETPVPTTAPSGCRSRTNRARASPYTVPQPRNSEPVSAGYVETMSTGVCGSDPYMAPELFSGETYYSAPKVDVWALGIMYFALHHMQFPWAVAHADRDPRYRAYVRASSDFLGTWFDGATGPEMAHEVSPAHTLFDTSGSAATATTTGAQGKKKFAHFRLILRRPSTASSASTASDENAPVISDRATGYILETYGLPLRTIGQGTGGYVKLHQACDGRHYAVKTFTFPDSNDRTRMTSTGMNVRQWKHLLDEASFSLSLRHPNVIRTYQFVRENDGTVYSIMEYCEKDLFTVVQDGSLSKEDIDRLFFQLLSGVQYLHDVARVAHRDMKLDNLCVDEEGDLKIIDFGCSSTFDPLMPTQTRGICGSDPYIAPEVFVPRAPYDPRKVDVWALGIIYLAMTSGHFPWEVAKKADSNYALYLKYHGRVIDHWLPKDSPSNAVIKSMLTIEPLERPTIDLLMKEPWVVSLSERYSCTNALLSKTSTLAVTEPESNKPAAVYGASNVGYSSTSTVSSGLSISSGF